MLKPELHNTILRRVLIQIYKNPHVRTVLGFKGGTAALIFYNLPRYSVDLDFDLLDETKKDIVFSTIQTILRDYGELSEAAEKRYTLFYLLRYEKGQKNMKIDISKRASRSEYEIKEGSGPVNVTF